MRLARAVFVAALATMAAPASAGPVRVAVVGFTGDLTPQELTDLAVSVRGSLGRQADPQALAVVTREEMALIYNQRGYPCRPDDVGCIVEASDMWAGRLFIRGVVRKTSEGVIVGATLESVRGVLVAASQTPPSAKWDMETAVPVLVRELLDGEKAYRNRMMGGTPSAPSASAAGATGPAVCKCLAIQATYVAGQLVADEDGLRFESAPAGATKYAWRYTWDKVAKLEASKHGVNPAISLASTTKDALLVYFNLGDDRDKCLAAIVQKRPHH